jgi:hypothetical protein
MNGVVQAAVFCLLGSVNVAADSLTEFNAEFDISVAGLPAGKSVYSLAKQSDGNYQIQTISSATGVFKLFLSDEYILTSQFSLKEAAVQPQWFLDEKTGEDELLKLSFDWQNQLLKAENDKGIKQIPIQAVHIENGFTIKAQLNALSGLEIKQALLNN